MKSHNLMDWVWFEEIKLLYLFAFAAWLPLSGHAATNGFILDSQPQARFEFQGPVGERIHANLEQWLLTAPQANPGMLEMFRGRDRRVEPPLVPWAGEFAGKYLISAIQALRMTEDARLRTQVSNVVSELIACQTPDGYIGPFPKDIRLIKNWDLWGHYHVIEALLLWHEYSGDSASLTAAQKAGDYICQTFLDTGKRVIDAGDCEMNMSILTGMAMLYRISGDPRYLRMAREVEKDWENAGDYLRAGLDGREFYQSPKPRWESLHDLQGLVEMWRITGDPKYRQSFEHHWRSIRRWDRRNTGGFSSGEQATGNPYASTAIETCCTVAWMAITIDYLKLTGNPDAADDLELSTLNAGLGAQHPSGRWFTYNTPMDGTREASAHTIVFQARSGTPELNCCSVNGPRILGMLSEWAFMTASDGLTLNWLGAGHFTAQLPDGTPVSLQSSSDAWLTGQTEWRFQTSSKAPFTLHIRIPSWATTPKLTLNGKPVANISAGQYTSLSRKWKKGDKLALTLDMPLHIVAGANETQGKVSLYRGPILLAFDVSQNGCDDNVMPLMDLANLGQAKTVSINVKTTSHHSATAPVTKPWLTMDIPAVGNKNVRLVDFASAGAAGTRYRSWLSVTNPPPAPSFAQQPCDDALLNQTPTVFSWTNSMSHTPTPPQFRVEFSTNEHFTSLLWTTNTGSQNQITLPPHTLPLPHLQPLYWRVITQTQTKDTTADVPPSRLLIK